MNYSVHEQDVDMHRSTKLSARLSMSKHNMGTKPSRGSLYLQYMTRLRGLIRA